MPVARTHFVVRTDAGMAIDSQFLAEPRGLARTQRRFAAWVVRVGVAQAAVVLTLASTAASLLLTRLWLALQGVHDMGDAFAIALAVPVPIALVCGGWTLHLVAALERARRQVEQLAITDALTGVSNRRYFMHCAQRQFELARRHGTPLALMIFDVDHFKRINDEHGHLEGDRLLAEIGTRCQALMRTSDLLARFGGEEFIVLLPSTRQDQAVRLAERVRQAVSRIGGGTAAVTVSIGVVERHAGHDDLAALIQAADQALYAAKRGGRDQVRTRPAQLDTLGPVPSQP